MTGLINKLSSEVNSGQIFLSRYEDDDTISLDGVVVLYFMLSW